MIREEEVSGPKPRRNIHENAILVWEIGARRPLWFQVVITE